MSKFKPLVNSWLLRLSVASCALSIMVFSYFLIQSSRVKNQALAVSYNADQVILAVNKERQKNNLPALIVNPKLVSAAENKAKDMATKRYFSHISPIDGKKWSDFIKDSGYNYVEAGENLANGFDAVGDMVNAWMNSPSHRENILNKTVVETGIGVEFGMLNDYPTIFVAQVFGRLATTDTAPKQSSDTPQTVQTQVPAPDPKKITDDQTLSDLIDFPEIKPKQ